jgi:hypothetical protein
MNGNSGTKTRNRVRGPGRQTTLEKNHAPVAAARHARTNAGSATNRWQIGIDIRKRLSRKAPLLLYLTGVDAATYG